VRGRDVVYCRSAEEALLALSSESPAQLALCSADAASRIQPIAHWLERREMKVSTVLLYDGASPADVTAPRLEPVSVPDASPTSPATPRLDSLGDAQNHRILLDHLVKGIAHDFNNMLAGIMGEVQLAESRNTDSRIAPHLQRAHQGCYRLAGEIRRLLHLEEANLQRRGMFDLNAFLRDEIGGIQALLPGQAACTLETSPGPAWLYAAPGTMRVILHNLVEYGLTEIRTCNAARVVVESLRDDDSDERTEVATLIKVELSAREDRDAAPPAMSRASDGGVSLAVVWKLVADLGGYIDTASHQNEHCTIHVYLPSPAKAAVPTGETMNRLKGDETIALLTRDRSAARATARNLESMGYSAPVFSSLDELISGCSDAPMGGLFIVQEEKGQSLQTEATYHRIRQALPAVPILLAIPDSSIPEGVRMASDARLCAIRSPLDLREILTTVRALKPLAMSPVRPRAATTPFQAGG